MKVVLDTNVFLVSISKRSRYRPIFDSLLNKAYELLISNEILTEYEEIITRKTNEVVAHNIMEMLTTRSNVQKIDVYYRWNLIAKDEDDNKFIDCAIAGNADFVVSEDKHFKGVNANEFPKISLLKTDGFLQQLQSMNR